MIDQRTAPYAALMLRLTLGFSFLAHAFLKLLVFTPAGTAKFFVSIGLPGWFGDAVMIAELIGGVMLILGVYARYVALVLIPDLIGAIVFVHAANGWSFANPGGGWEYPAFWAAALFAQFLLGDGAYALAGDIWGKGAPKHMPTLSVPERRSAGAHRSLHSRSLASITLVRGRVGRHSLRHLHGLGHKQAGFAKTRCMRAHHGQ